MKNKKFITVLFSSILLFAILILTFLSVNKDKLSSLKYAVRSLHNQARVYIFADELVNNSERVFGSFDQVRLSWNEDWIVHNWNYCTGIMMKAFLKVGFHRRFLERFYNDNICDDGTVNNKINKRNRYVRGALDDIVPARTLFYMLNSPHAQKYKLNLDWIYINELSTQPLLENLGNNFQHKVNNRAWVKYPFGLDGIYSGIPFWIEYEYYILGGVKDETADEIFKRLNWISQNMRNKEGLYYHGCQRDGKTMNGYVWLRGVGWYTVGLVEILELYPEGEKKEILKQQLKEHFDTMIKYQDKKTGLWYNIIFPDNVNLGCNRLESSGSAMMAYAMMSAYLNDFVTDKKYAYAGLKAFNGVVENKLKSDFLYGHYLTDIYKVAIVFDDENADRYYDCSYYIEDDPKGVAPLIMASSVVAKTLMKLYVNN